MSNIVIDFINKFKEVYTHQLEDVYTHGWCYYFAIILKERFSGSIYYLPIENHFICKIEDKFYDINGVVTTKEAIDWDEYKLVDNIHYNRIVRDCMLKV